MANTTNYNWETPDDTDLVKDGAAAIRTLGNSIDTTTKNLNPETTTGDIAYRSATANTNTRLPIGSTGQVLTVAAGVPSWASPSDQTPLTTKGDLFTFTTVDARLGVGANGTVLTADSAEATGLKWAAPAGGGKVLQVVNVTNSTNTTSASSSFADTGLSASITPSSASSKVLVIVHTAGVGKYSTNSQTAIALKLLRGATDLIRFEDIGTYTGTAVENYIGSISTTYLDSPATTSSTTYKTQLANRAASGTVIINATYGGGLNPSSTITLMEIGA
jgi:hypothetical protein